MILPVMLAATMAVGCRPCRCLDGTRFATEIPCEECFTECTKVGSLPSQCRSSEAVTEEVLLPVADPMFMVNE